MDAAVEDDDHRPRPRSCDRPPGRRTRRTSRRGTVPVRAGVARRAGPDRSASRRRSRSGRPRDARDRATPRAARTGCRARRRRRPAGARCRRPSPGGARSGPCRGRARRARRRRARSMRRTRAGRAARDGARRPPAGAATTRSAASIPNLPAPSSPTRRTRSSRARSETATRSMTGWTRPADRAIPSSRASSPGDSTVTARIPAATAAASSSSRLPGPVITIRSGLDPGPAGQGELPAGRDVGTEARAGRGAARPPAPGWPSPRTRGRRPAAGRR